MRTWRRWDDASKAQFMAAVRLFVAALKADSRFPIQLRIHKIKGGRLGEDVWSMTIGYDWRALFTYGPEIRPGEKHVIWLVSGSHDDVY